MSSLQGATFSEMENVPAEKAKIDFESSKAVATAPIVVLSHKVITFYLKDQMKMETARPIDLSHLVVTVELHFIMPTRKKVGFARILEKKLRMRVTYVGSNLLKRVHAIT